MNKDRFVLIGAVWNRLAPHLPGKSTDQGVTAFDNRLCLEAVLWRVRAGLTDGRPGLFGNWNSAFRRFRRGPGFGRLFSRR